MAIYHCSIKIISRGKGKSAVAAAAYRSGERITNERDGVTHDYSRKRGILYSEILLPAHAPREFAERSVLWNSVEKIEKQKNSQLSRELEIALPAELTQEQNISLVRRFVSEQFVAMGMCADIAVHDKKGNPHAHIMLTMRPLNEDGTWGAKVKKINKIRTATTDWDDRSKAEEWRKAWAAYCNTALRINKFDTLIDHRSYERQGVDLIPTVHIGVAATQMERRGIRTERGDINREIEVSNKQIRQLRARIIKLSDWLKTEAVNTKPPTLAEVITGILNRQGQPGMSQLKAASQALIFLQENEIYNMAGLEQKIVSMYENVQRLRDDLKLVERRIKTLDEHLLHSENFKNYRKFKKQYDELYSLYEDSLKV